MQTFEQYIEGYFVGLNEIDGIPITKDNFEDMASRWLEKLEIEDIIKIANLYAKEEVLKAEKEGLEQQKELIESIRNSFKV